MPKLILPAIFFIIACKLAAQNNITMFPDKLSMEPFYANFLEPKIGFLFTTGENNIRLDIGASRDLLQSVNKTENTTLSLGADFFTFTKLRGEDNFHFPVDAVDYLFGINSTWQKNQSDAAVGARLRFSHISAHLVDGHYDPQKGWREGKAPHVYSREFFELTPFYQTDSYRGYLGITYIVHVVPHDVKPWMINCGAEYFYRGISPLINPFIAYDLRTIVLDKTTINNTFLAGIKFGQPYSAGVRVQYTYFSGKNIHGEYYDVKENYSSIGLTIDF